MSCESGVTLSTSVATGLLSITGENDTVTGCGFDGVGTNNSSEVVYAFGAKNVTFTGNTVNNGGRFGIHLRNVATATISDNHFTGNIQDAIYGDYNTSGITVQNNTIDASSTTMWHKGIGFKSNGSSYKVSDITIDGNHITNGNSFCVEIGAFGGNAPTGITVTNNVCTQATVSTGFGGYSFDTVTSPDIEYNTYTNGTGNAPNTPGLELVSGSGAIAKHNSIDGPVTINKQSGSTLDSNTITEAVQSSSAAIYMGTSGSSPAQTTHDNTVTNNSVTLSFPISGAFRAVWLQCNAPSINCDNNEISNNTFNSANFISSDAAVHIENDYQSTAHVNNTTVSSNSASNWKKCYVQSASGVTSTVTGWTGTCTYP